MAVHYAAGELACRIALNHPSEIDVSESETPNQPTPDNEIPGTTESSAPESTVGTGTAMALGCIAGTVVLIAFGLIFLFFATMR